MSEFVARVGTSGGDIEERLFVAETEESLRRDLDQKGYYIFSIQRKARGFRLPFQGGGIPDRDFTIFNHEMATLLKAGLPLLQGLDILLERMRNPLFRDLLTEIRDKVRDGTALSDAFAAYPQYFPPLYSASLRAGERSGEMETVIRRYMTFARVVTEVRKAVVQAMIYPLILLLLSLGAIVILMKKAVPEFAKLYSSFDQELPAMTQLVVGASDNFNAHWPWFLVGAVLAVIGLRVAAETERGREAIDRAKLRVPFIGPIWKKFAVSQLTRALATLMRGGIPLVSALDTAAGSVGNGLIRRRAREAVKDIREGEPLSVALERTETIQPMVIEMVKVGESTGALPEMLGNVADYYDDDIKEELQRVLTLVEPLLLVGMGGVIAFMLIAMYLPIFQMQSVIE